MVLFLRSHKRRSQPILVGGVPPPVNLSMGGRLTAKLCRTEPAIQPAIPE